MIRWVVVLLLLLLPVTVFGGAAEDFANAVSLYDQGQFQNSAGAFQSIIDKGYSSPELFYNAGCAYYKAGEIGLAIANFRRAERLSPDDEDIKANLQYARLYTVDKFEDRTEGLSNVVIARVLNALSPNQYFLISVLLIALIFGMLILKRLGKMNVGATTLSIIAVLAIVCAGAMVWVLQNNYLLEEGVIIVEQTEIMSGPGDDFELQFEGHEGLTFQILESRPDYFLGLFANQLKGWVKRSDVVTI